MTEKMNILITTSSFSCSEFGERLTVIKNPYGRRLTENEVLDLVKKHQPVGIIAGLEQLTGKVLGSAKNLKVISRCGIGLDSVDLEAADKFGIRVINTPDTPTQAVAELTVGLIIAVLRKILLLDSKIRNGDWKRPKGNLMNGKTLGIIGCGRIGSRTAFICSAFGCKCMGFDPYVKTHPLIEMVELKKLLKDSDIVTLHIPLTAKNRNLISEKQLGIMKKNAILINAARGGLVDEDALYNALKTETISGAALDCFTSEPYSGKLKELDNIVLTPHIGSSTYETRKIMEQEAVDNLLAVLLELNII